MSKPKMIIGMHLGNGYGALADAWRMPGVDPRAYTNFDAKVRRAQAAERDKFQFLFLPDGPSPVSGDIRYEPSGFNLDVMMTLAAVARGTERIGMVATGPTTFNEAFELAWQFKALDIMSHGRAGWNAVTSAGQDVAANYGQPISSSADRYSRAHEMIQIVHALWASWGTDAWVADPQTGEYAKDEEIAPINLGGEFVASRGPLFIPFSEQGQPVIFHAAGPRPIDYQPVVADPAVEVADHMQEWFEAEAAAGFWVIPDVYEDGLDAFVDDVVPIRRSAGCSTMITKAPPCATTSARRRSMGSTRGWRDDSGLV